jgi:hypothetical protein
MHRRAPAPHPRDGSCTRWPEVARTPVAYRCHPPTRARQGTGGASGPSMAGRRQLALQRPILRQAAVQGWPERKAGWPAAWLSDLIADGRTRRATGRGRRPVIRPPSHAPSPGMGRRRSAGRPAGVARGGSTVVLQEGEASFLFHFFFFLFIYYCLIGLTNAHVHVSRSTNFKCQLSAYRWPAMSDLVSIRRKSTISAHCNKFQKISWFYAIQT